MMDGRGRLSVAGGLPQLKFRFVAGPRVVEAMLSIRRVTGEPMQHSEFLQLVIAVWSGVAGDGIVEQATDGVVLLGLLQLCIECENERDDALAGAQPVVKGSG